MTYHGNYFQDLFVASRLLQNTPTGEPGGGIANPPATPPATPPAVPPVVATPPVNEPEEIKFDKKQKAEIARLVAEAVTSAKAEAKTEFERIAKEKEEKDKGEWQNLYEALKPKYDELEVEATALRDIVTAEVAEKVKLLPDGMDALMPEGSAVEQLKWLQKAGQFKGKLPDAPPLPPKEGSESEEQMLKAAMETRQGTGLYS